jgi:hypothetical protein
MIALVCFVLAVLASPFWSKGRVGRKNAAVQYQLALLGVIGKCQVNVSIPRQ